MLGALSVVSVGVGSVLALGAKRYPERTDALEICAGALLVVGLGLRGWVLPSVS